MPNYLLSSLCFSLTVLLKGIKIIVISVGNLISSFFFHVDVLEQIRLWVIIILHQLFLNQTLNFYPISCWSSVFYFIQKCIRWIPFERYYLIIPNFLLTSLSFSLTLVLKGKKIIVISVGNLFSFFFHVDVVEQISSGVIIILHQLFFNQTSNSYPITCWSSVSYFIKKCIRSISFEPYYLIMPNSRVSYSRLPWAQQRTGHGNEAYAG